MMMTPRRKLFYCLIGNVLILGLVVFLVSYFASSNVYWNVGPHKDLILVSVHIDTLEKYIALLALIAVIEGASVLIGEIGIPILGFNVYNPDKKVITDFTKNELQFYANAMFMVSGLRGILIFLAQLSQIDIAVWDLIVSQTASVFTIRFLLNEKTFKTTDFLLNEKAFKTTDYAAVPDSPPPPLELDAVV